MEAALNMKRSSVTLACLLVFLTGTFFLLVGFLQFYQHHAQKKRTAMMTADTTTVSTFNPSSLKQKSVPILISIPKFHMSAPILPVGLDKEGRMATVPKANTIAWYAFGSVPGQVGNSILAGHRDWNGVLGSFWNLGGLRTGDFVHILLSNSKNIAFKVKSVHIYPAQAVPPEVMDPGGSGRTTLITCIGDFIRDKGGYQSRVVVILQKTNDQPKG
jgi:sortase (surface protein transpeptidase)